MLAVAERILGGDASVCKICLVVLVLCMTPLFSAVCHADTMLSTHGICTTTTRSGNQGHTHAPLHSEEMAKATHTRTHTLDVESDKGQTVSTVLYKYLCAAAGFGGGRHRGIVELSLGLGISPGVPGTSPVTGTWQP